MAASARHPPETGDGTVDAWAAGLQRSLARAFSDSPSQYDRVGVLVLCWAEDDFAISCKIEAQRIVDLLKKRFRYEVETCLIPAENSRAARNALEETVVRFKRRYDVDGEANLMIVYYTGHADPDERRGKAVWAA